MKVLVIINELDHLDASLSLTGRMLNGADEVRILGIISASKEIPTTSNGRVLENCTEFDLSSYEEVKAEFLSTIKAASGDNLQFDADVFIGDRGRIVKTECRSFEPDLLIMASELTTAFEDIFVHTQADQIMEKTHTPLLSFKCEKVWSPLNDIGILVNPAHVDTLNLQLVESICKNTSAKTQLFLLGSKEEDLDALKALRDFAENLGIDRSGWHLLRNDNSEEAVHAMIDEHPIDLLVVLELNDEGHGHGPFGNLGVDITNHFRIPILTF